LSSAGTKSCEALREPQGNRPPDRGSSGRFFARPSPLFLFSAPNSIPPKHVRAPLGGPRTLCKQPAAARERGTSDPDAQHPCLAKCEGGRGGAKLIPVVLGLEGAFDGQA